MAVQCPPELFELFEKSCGGWITPDDTGQIFLYQAQAEFEFPGVVSLDIPELDDKSFDDWEKFEYWCDGMRGELMWALVADMGDYDEETITPRQLFKTKDAVKEKILSTLCSSESEGAADVTCVEVESNGATLFLIYEDSMAWALGHGNSVLVVKSLDELTPELGYYPVR
jgi:hypothetical protein